MRRSCDLLVSCAAKQIRPTMVWVPIPVLLPGKRTSTEDQPAKGLYAQLPAVTVGRVFWMFSAGRIVWGYEPRATASAVLTREPTRRSSKRGRTARPGVLECPRRFQFWGTGGIHRRAHRPGAAGYDAAGHSGGSGDNPTGGGGRPPAEVLEELLRRGFKIA